jgi:hypothetical protein
MKPLRANFARQRAVGRWWWGCIAVGVSLAVALTLDRAFEARHAQSLHAEVAAHEEFVRATRAAAVMLPPSVLKAYDLSAREMLQQHQTPWHRLLDAMESVDLQGVRVVSLDYEAAKRQARIEIAVPQQALALQYVALMNLGIPDSETAWRCSVMRIEKGRADDTARATLLARWATE